MTTQALQGYVQEEQAKLLQLAEQRSKVWADHTKRIERAMLRVLERQATPVTPEEAARILAELRGVLADAARLGLSEADVDGMSVIRRATETQAEFYRRAYEHRQVLADRSDRAARVFRSYSQRVEDGRFLKGDYWQAKRTDWAQEFVDRNKQVSREVQRRMTQGMATGRVMSTRDIAAEIRPLVDGRTGRMDAETWSRAYVRTEYAQTYNEFAEQAAVAVGVTKFVNIGVADERQSRECYEASQEAPKTMEEWDAWRASNGKGGRPGTRHVFNCRCTASGVPPGLEDEDWTQPNERYQEAA